MTDGNNAICARYTFVYRHHTWNGYAAHACVLGYGLWRRSWSLPFEAQTQFREVDYGAHVNFVKGKFMSLEVAGKRRG